eukprot:TRINITY_DN23142_c0_g1_i1.p1 TRINITY_DN23142_c0_g1~~TRINITY_DN23142_c0_g1_i1.p1  ORF type:complete len:150 (+),score=15.98 TRINITY_DN23142_c0_g1_i1:103-552(+)
MGDNADDSDLGTKRNAWPEFRGQPLGSVKKSLLDDEETIHVWGAEKKAHEKPGDYGSDEAIWLYPTHDHVVYHIPQRGKWVHPNRAGVGWKDLVGATTKKAFDEIFAEVVGVKIVYGQASAAPKDINRWDRVFLQLGDNDTVEVVPKIG